MNAIAVKNCINFYMFLEPHQTILNLKLIDFSILVKTMEANKVIKHKDLNWLAN